ncbi:LacI family DNA-binding transcriptional regulator [Opitutus sp. ER46]|uniref:LacI family DNA-binding transcriptional regulator n=1 Tax=Opitutus sp. ER46 TaxID=2161864 RepID=UPI000D2FFCD1|nr:LacI family DNA-binding transcriptional regulator [Opitutus sp. ER46]PTX94477.1 hypothetical protein DB354_12085 [Opitutus sp. ER46]
MLLTELARKARVSPATVSRAINQPHRVAPESLARIRAVMKEHNYVPAPVNRRPGPKSRKPEQRRIGVWFVGGRATNPNLSWFEHQLMQIQSQEESDRTDVRLLFSNTANELPRNLGQERVEGLIIQGMEPAPECLAKLRETPHVWFMTRRSASYPGDYVEPNNEENGELAAEYLHQRGHKSVAVVAVDPEYSAIVTRNQAFTRRATELGLTVHPVLGRSNPGVSYLEIAPLHSESNQLARRLLERTPRATGIYLPADHFCGSFFRALREAGQQPGRDYDAILGNYNEVIYHNLDHSPAAIDINLTTLVRRVIDQVLWRIQNPGAPGRVGIKVSPRLVLPGTVPPAHPF